jgi:hypothetical protein
MTDRRDWSQLTPEQRDEAIATARHLLERGATRWHSIAGMCGLRSGIPLRKAIDPEYLAQQQAADRERQARKRSASAGTFNKTSHERRAHAERGRAHGRLASMLATAGKRGAIKGLLNTPSHAPVTLPRVQFLED